MMDVPRGRRLRLALLAGLGAFALLAGVVPAAGAAAHSPAAPSLATQASSGSRCDAGVLSSSLHLAQVTVASAVMNTSGTFTSPGQPPLTGLPAFCDVTLTQTDAAGNAIHIYVWLPASWNGRFQGVGGAVYECGPIFSETAAAIRGGYASAATDCGVPPPPTC